MANTLIIILLFLIGVLLVQIAIRSMSYRAARGHSFQALLNDEGMPDDVRLTARQIGVDRLARRAVSKGDPAYESIRTKPKPRFSSEQRHEILAARWRARQDYLDNMQPGVYHYLIIFIVASVAGLVVEMAFMAATQGRTEVRAGLVWGPFSPLYGIGAVLLTVILWNFRKSSLAQVFVVSALLGGALEQTTGVCMDYFAHAQSWTYLGLPDAITQWVAWRSLLMWGVIGVIWCRLVMPQTLYIIGEPTTRMQIVLIALLTAFLSLDVTATVYCFFRKAQRDVGIPPQNVVDEYVDHHFSDEFIQNRFQNMVVNEDLAPNG